MRGCKAFKQTAKSKPVRDTPDKLLLDLPRRKIPDVLPHQREIMRTYASQALTSHDVALQLAMGRVLVLVGSSARAPLVKQQRQPTSNCAGVSDIVLFATGQYRMLYALLAGCGPLRAGEALGLEVEKHISSDFRTLSIVQKAKRGEIQPYLKTKNGMRQVDLCTSLADMLREFIGDRRAGLLFHSSTGAQLLQSNTLSDRLHPVLNYVAHEYGGFNIFRRFRLTHVEKSDCPESLKHFWSGHAPKHVSERYVKLAQDRDFRLMWAEKIGLGFELPGASGGQRGQLLQFRKAV